MIANGGRSKLLSKQRSVITWARDLQGMHITVCGLMWRVGQLSAFAGVEICHVSARTPLASPLMSTLEAERVPEGNGEHPLVPIV